MTAQRLTRWNQLILVLVALLLLAACSPTTEPTEPTSPAPTEAAEPVEDDGAAPEEEATEPAEEPEPTEATEPAEEPEPAEATATTEEAESTDTTPTADGSAATPAVERLRIGIIGDESTLTPYTYVTGYPGWNLLTLQYDTLMQVDLEGVPQPWLATAVEVSDDGLEYTLTLRDDVAWHDGEPLTADDVKFTFDYFLANTQSRFTRDLRGVTSTEVGDDGQVVVTLENANPSFPLRALADVPIIPEHIWADVSAPEEHVFESGTNIGTGPYKLAEYEPEQFYRFEANTDYFAATPNVAELVLIKYADDAGSLAALRSNEVDMLARPIAPEQIDLLDGVDGIAVVQGPLYTTQMLVYDTQRAPFNNLEFRQAMGLAINREDLSETVFLGAATIGNPGWTHPSSPYYNDAVTAEYDPERARQILDDAGIVDSDGDNIREIDGEPITFEFLVNGSDALRLRLAEIVREMLLEIGVDAQVLAVEQATWEEAIWPGFDVSQGRNYAMGMWGWSAPTQADPTQITQLLHSDPALGSLNLSGFVSEQADALSEELLAATDESQREELLDELQLLVAEELPFMVLLYPDGAYAYRAETYDEWDFMTGQGVLHKWSLLPNDIQP